MTRAEIRAQMAAMKNSVNTMYNNNSKQGMCEPKMTMPDENRLSSLSVIMSKQMNATLKSMNGVKGPRKSVQVQAPRGPHVAGFAVDKQHMPVVTNETHN